jgi:hypothetical protein
MTAPPREQEGWARAVVSPQTASALVALRPFFYLFVLASINIYICREAFFVESNGHFNSIHGEWLALARLGDFHLWSSSWWPWWGDGSPVEYTYAPLVPVLIAAIARLEHCSPALALHQLTGVTYFLTPVLLYLASWRLSAAAGYSFAAALACSLLSPITLIVPDTTFHISSLGDARRLVVMFDWDDLPHVMCITLAPLAVWFLSRALKRRSWLDYGVTGLVMAGMMLANMFGLVLTALIVITVPLTLEWRPRPSHFIGAATTSACAYIVVCAWLPPSLILKIHSNSVLDGEAAQTFFALIAFGIVAMVCAGVHSIAVRRVDNWAFRWLLLFGCVVLLIPFLDFYAGLHFVPQPVRYKLEADLAIIWTVVFSLRPLIERYPVRVRILLILPLLVLAERQIVAYRRFARPMLRPVDTAQSIEYQTAKWIEQHLPDQRVMMMGSIGFWANAFTDVPQVGAQPYTTAPNWSQQIATYIIKAGQNPEDRDAAASILWLKAFGAQAVTVPGPRSPEYWKPFANPRKFDGVLPVLWRERDTAVYRVSERPFSLAHVLRPSELVHHAPISGLDVGELRQFVAAIEDPAAPPATLHWEGNNRAVIQARLQPGEVVSAQITYHPGWHARVNGLQRETRPDGIGLIALDTGCTGDCRIVLDYDGGAELRTCRIASAAFSALLMIVFVGRGLKRH